MSFLDKIANNKTLLALGLGGAAVVAGIAYLVKNYNDEHQNSGQIHENVQKGFDIDLEIQKLIALINLQNPSLQDVKRILVFSLDASKKQIFKFSKTFKIDRKSYNKQKRNQNLDHYLRMVAQGMTQIQQIGMNMQQQILSKIGIAEHHFAKYQRQLGPFLQQQMMSQGVGSQSGKEITLAEVKKAINLQIEYMENHGDELVDRLVNTCSGWSEQQKMLVPTLISIYIADEVFEEHPEIDEDELQGAQMKFQHHLQNEMSRLQTVMAPVMGKLTEGLGFGGYGNQGGYPGMDMMGGMDMGGMGGMGGMGQGGPTMEQLQQLQQLRIQDPQAFEQLMYMMQQGMQGMQR